MKVRRGFVFVEMVIVVAIITLIMGVIFCAGWNFFISPLSVWGWLGGMLSPLGILALSFLSFNVLAEWFRPK